MLNGGGTSLGTSAHLYTIPVSCALPGALRPSDAMGTAVPKPLPHSADKWLHFSAPHMFRDGVFFDFVAGIYGKLQPVITPRGLPAEVEGEALSEVTRFCYDQDRRSYHLHHEGWLGADDLIELQRRINEHYMNSGKSPLEYDLETNYLHTYIDGNPIASYSGWDDARLIFWFDN